MSASLQMLFTMKYSMMRSALLEWDRANPAVSRSSAVSFSERQRDIASAIAVFLLGL